jgi:hypothetical protein
VLALECAAQVPQQNLEVRFRQVASDQALHDPSQPGQAPADVTVSTRRPMADNRAPPPRRRHTDRQQKRDRIDVSTWMPGPTRSVLSVLSDLSDLWYRGENCHMRSEPVSAAGHAMKGSFYGDSFVIALEKRRRGGSEMS